VVVVSPYGDSIVAPVVDVVTIVAAPMYGATWEKPVSFSTPTFPVTSFVAADPPVPPLPLELLLPVDPPLVVNPQFVPESAGQ